MRDSLIKILLVLFRLVETSEVFGIDNPAAEWTAEDEAAKNV